MILVMVGATNVGSMTFPFDPSVVTNQFPFKNRRLLMDYPTPKAIAVGGELGIFNLGSTVVLLAEPKMNWNFQEPHRVRMGESI